LRTLPNVQFRRRSPQVGDIFAKTALLLMPSQCEEALGRVVLEALANSIPVVASRIGGIPEAVSEGGVLLSASAPPQRWAEAIDTILSDKDLYSRLGACASASGDRPEFKPENVGTRFLQLAGNHLGR